MSNTQSIPEGANRLIFSTSPYLLQHSHNPVDWYPWGDEALARAKKEDKPILVSIGYSSCHWCHVMERETFENDSIAQLMNAHFICIKVDREERPDIDQIYMDAVQAMGLNGGWPLNVFLTPETKPFYGGTYFPPAQWVELLQGINKAYISKRNEIDGSADKLAEALSTSEMLRFKLKAGETDFTTADLEQMYNQLSVRFDSNNGGLTGAPKFPMPVIWNFVLNNYNVTGDKETLLQIERTLDAMAMGGLYDQIGGGFSRYSTDSVWLVPHFEKMLYDNAQLIGLYSNGYKILKKPLYKNVVTQTINWLEREMTRKEGGFFSSIDADSEGEEGKFYVWKKNEFDSVTGTDASIMSEYYQVSEKGNWEDGKNILHRTANDNDFAREHDYSSEDFQKIKSSAMKKLLSERNHRVHPGLDNKILASWNGLMVKALTQAYEAFGDPHFLELAKKTGHFVADHLLIDQKLYRTMPGENSGIEGYLDDYAFVIDGFIGLYEVTFDQRWLDYAEGLTDYAMKNFLDPKENMFFYTGTDVLIARKKELFDNVIPSSNSQMAINLHFLGIILDRKDYQDLSQAMVSRFRPMLNNYLADATNWATLYSYYVTPTAEIAIVGPELYEKRKELSTHFIPNKVLMGTGDQSQLPLLDGKTLLHNKTTIYVCYNKTCKLPVNQVSEALSQLK